MTDTVKDAPKGETRGQLIGRKLHERQAEVEALIAKISDYRRREDEARELALRDSPAQSAYSLGARPQKLRADRKEAEKRLETARLEVGTLSQIDRELDDEAREAAHEERRRALKRLRADERKAIEAMAEKLSELVRIYSTDYASVVEALDLLAHPQTAREIPAGLRESWRSECLPTISPCFADVENCLQRLLGAMCDPTGAGYRDLKNAGAGRLDYSKALPGLTPDLRAVLRAPTLSVLEASRSRPGRPGVFG